MEDVLGNDFNGVLSSDFYAAYNTYAGFHQRCWVHYLRDVHTLTEEYPNERRLRRWATSVHRIYEDARHGLALIHYSPKEYNNGNEW